MDNRTDEEHGEEVCECRRMEDIRAMHGKRGVVCGVYRQCAIQYKMNAKPVYRGHAAIKLEDETEVLLEPEWKREAVRSKEEIAMYEGKRVKVKGVIYHIPPEPEEPIAHLVMPCIADIEFIHSV